MSKQTQKYVGFKELCVDFVHHLRRKAKVFGLVFLFLFISAFLQTFLSFTVKRYAIPLSVPLVLIKFWSSLFVLLLFVKVFSAKDEKHEKFSLKNLLKKSIQKSPKAALVWVMVLLVCALLAMPLSVVLLIPRFFYEVEIPTIYWTIPFSVAFVLVSAGFLLSIPNAMLGGLSHVKYLVTIPLKNNSFLTAVFLVLLSITPGILVLLLSATPTYQFWMLSAPSKALLAVLHAIPEAVFGLLYSALLADFYLKWVAIQHDSAH